MDMDTLRWYWGIFVEAWKLFRKYQNVNGDVEWKQLVSEAEKLIKKYPGDFPKRIILVVLDELERIRSEWRKKVEE